MQPVIRKCFVENSFDSIEFLRERERERVLMNYSMLARDSIGILGNIGGKFLSSRSKLDLREKHGETRFVYAYFLS